ncbi:MAG: flippase-like domain-containing protein, partial [Phycisphaerales bacterium]|nr:flippase-like domain-containing protein [Phycisphaerales bacterium]
MDPGLHAPSGPVLPDLRPPRRQSRGQAVFQVVGFAVGLVVLGWVVQRALAPENREALQRLWQASWTLVGLLVLATVGRMLADGALFWLTLRPLRRLPVADVLSVNVVATLLSVLPFKLGLVLRMVIHRRRDGVPFKDIIAWMAGMAALGLAVILPVAAAGWWRGQIDALWWLAAGGGSVLAAGAGVVVGRLCSSPRLGWLAAMSLGSYRVVSHAPTVVAAVAVRGLDLLLISLRFWLAAKIVGAEIGFGTIVVIATTYILVIILAPAGRLGFAEGAAAGVAMLQHSSVPVEVVTLTVTAVELAAAAVLSIPAAVWLRLDRVLLG